MSIFTPAPAPWPSRVLSIVRIVFGFLFITFGTMKIFGWPSVAQPMPPMPAFSQMWIGGWMEIIGGVLITIGLFTRPVAFIASGMCAAAYFIAHAPKGLYPAANGGETVMLYCFIFLYLAAAGGGAWSADAQRGKP